MESRVVDFFIRNGVCLFVVSTHQPRALKPQRHIIFAWSLIDCYHVDLPIVGKIHCKILSLPYICFLEIDATSICCNRDRIEFQASTIFR